MDLSRAASLLSPAQIKSIAGSTRRINIWDGAIRSGKTMSSLLRWLIYVAQAPPGELVISGRTAYTIGRNVFTPLADVALFGPLAAHTSYTLGAPTGTILGRLVHVIGANDVRAETKLRGLTCAGAYVDEATLVSQAFFTQLLGRMSVPGAQLFCTTNPDNPGHWLRKDFILRSAELDLSTWHFTLDDNPSLTSDYIAAIKSEFTGLFYRRFIQGEWIAAEGAVFDMWDPEVHIVDIIPPVREWIGVGVDYGTRNPFSALLLGLGVDGKLYLTSEWRYDARQTHRQLTDAEYSKRLRQWLREVPIPATRQADGSWLRGVSPKFVAVDPSAASFRVQLHHDGVSSVAADNEVIDGLRLMSTLLAARKLFVHRSCEGLIAELPGYAWDDTAAALGEDRPIKADDHSVDAARYVIKTTRSLWHSAVDLAA
ncbi:PBSX family phage terminase large subunit [Actinoallomurus sp. NPDC052274]|uniref:PBSX family phage terminase large subunit n=1 Tax=Actinoallomurus sp. NPDC052274 TaxID=3155420 RepID=UPI0034233A61